MAKKLFAAAALVAVTTVRSQLVVPNLADMAVQGDLDKSFGDAHRAVPLGNGTGTNYVFLQKFPLITAEIFYHTEVLVCPQEGFSAEEQQYVEGKLSGLTEFTQIEDSWWQSRTANCVELGYGGAFCDKECCGVGHRDMPLNKLQAVIGNADLKKKSLFLYGTGSFDGNTAFHKACDQKCWSNWSGSDYNPVTNNCNTFTSTVLSCVYGLSQKKPNLGVSDLVTVKGHCPATADSEDSGVVSV